jgi:hypothetical protein
VMHLCVPSHHATTASVEFIRDLCQDFQNLTYCILTTHPDRVDQIARLHYTSPHYPFGRLHSQTSPCSASNDSTGKFSCTTLWRPGPGSWVELRAEAAGMCTFSGHATSYLSLLAIGRVIQPPLHHDSISSPQLLLPDPYST